MTPSVFMDQIESTMGTSVFKKYIHDAVLRGQRCQRNWDTSKRIPKEDLDLIVHAATQAPSKQNCDFYNVIVIQDRDVLEKLYEASHTESRDNPQILANAVLIFTANESSVQRTSEQKKMAMGIDTEKDRLVNYADMHEAVGVAAGFVNVVSSMLGYQTGCDKCLNNEMVKEILAMDEKPILAMGIGFKDKTKSRRIGHKTGQKIRSFDKPEIKVTYV